MPKTVEPLTQEIIDRTYSGTSIIRLADGRGLYLRITPTGAKNWRLKYRFEGKGKEMSFGSYPEVGIEEARVLCVDAKRSIREGVDPCAARKNEIRAELEEGRYLRKHVSVRFGMEGFFEIWKGRSMVQLSSDEADFVRNQLTKLLG